MIGGMIELKVIEADLIKSQKKLSSEITDKQKELGEVSEKIYEVRERLLYLEEILRLAKENFPRLQKQSDLTQRDYLEIEKWVITAKTNDGLRRMLATFKELGKFFPNDIRTNFYGLVQKILMDGAYGQSMPKKIKK